MKRNGLKVSSILLSIFFAIIAIGSLISILVEVSYLADIYFLPEIMYIIGEYFITIIFGITMTLVRAVIGSQMYAYIYYALLLLFAIFAVYAFIKSIKIARWSKLNDNELKSKKFVLFEVVCIIFLFSLVATLAYILIKYMEFELIEIIITVTIAIYAPILISTFAKLNKAKKSIK